MQRLVKFLVIVLVIGLGVGFAVLASWDIPPPVEPTEIPVEIKRKS